MITSTDDRVFVVDDDDAMRRSLERLLAAHGLAVEGFATAEDFLERTSHVGPRCLVLDLVLPTMDGLEVQRRLVEAGQEMPIVFLSGHGDIPSTVQAMKGGAQEFLTKPADPPQLVDAVRRALAADRRTMHEREERTELRRRVARLSPRERQVFSLVIEGLLNKQIAARLGTTERTVKAQRGNLRRKLGADSVAELVRLADKIGGLDAAPLVPEDTGRQLVAERT
jgi:RNA polymerase sigma factor (sigma-70 family)